MKKILSIMLALAMMISLCACGSQGYRIEANITPINAGSDAQNENAADDEVAMDENTFIYKNGNIYTANENQDYVTAIVVRDGEFIYVGDDKGAEEFEKNVPEENIVDLEGNLVTPGLIEGHTHPFLISAMNAVHFEEIEGNITLEKSLEALKEFIDKHPDYDVYALGNFGQTLDLDAKKLDAICSDKPVVCFGAGFHCCYVNSKFMEKGNITKDTPDAVPGQSYFVRDKDGNPTGKIIELVETWIAFKKAVPLGKETLKEEFTKMVDLYHSMGFIGVAEGGGVAIDEETMLQVLAEMEDEEKLDMLVCPATIWYGHTVTDINEAKERALSQKERYTSELIYPGTIKMWADGTTGAQSALLKKPYDIDKPNVYGNEVSTPEDLTACAQMCKDNDLNCHFHAIGDQAIDNALTAYEKVGESTGTQSVVHFTITTPEMIEKASKIKDLIVNFTPVWANAFAKEEVDGVGERRNTYCLFKETMDAGITVNFGSDSNGGPESWDPILIILVTMFRNPDEEGLLLKGKACSFEEAVDAYSINVAKERRIDDAHGSIEEGKNADFVIWSVDDLDEELYEKSITERGEITSARPFAMESYLNGKNVYTRVE